jgi:hypothetical protein
MMINQRQIRNHAYTTLTEIKASIGREGELCTCLETDTTYKYVSNYIDLTDYSDDKYILTTGDGGTSRWVGVSGNYSLEMARMDYQSKGFVMTIDTTKTGTGSTTNVQFKIPLISLGLFHFYISWGDGTQNLIAVYNDADLTHTYVEAGIYKVHIEGIFRGLYFNNSGDKLKVLTVESFGTGYGMFASSRDFRGCSNITSIVNNGVNVPMVNGTLSSAFAGTAITSFNFVNWDFRAVTVIVSTFDSCPNLTSVDFTNALNLYNIEELVYVFKSCLNLPSVDLTPFYNDKLTSIAGLFYDAGITSIDLSVLNTAIIEDMSSLCVDCVNLTSLDLSGLDFSSLLYMYSAFSQSGVVTVDLSNSNFSAVDSLQGAFYGCEYLTTIDFTGIDLSAILYFSYEFYGCSSLVTIDVSPINFTNVTTLRSCFEACPLLTSIGLASMNVSACTNMTDFAKNSTINTTEYSNALIYWATLSLKTGVTCNMGSSKYNTAGQTAKNYIIATFSWVFIDGGLV